MERNKGQDDLQVDALGKSNFADAKNDNEQSPPEWNKADAEFEIEAQRRGHTDAQLHSRITPAQSRETIPEDWNKPPAETIPEDWNKPEQIPEDWNKPPAETIPEDWNKSNPGDDPFGPQIEPATEVNAVETDNETTTGKPLNGNQIESDEIATARTETIKPVLPPEIEQQYVNVGQKYYNRQNPGAVEFEDKGNKLETRTNNEGVATNLVKIAEARGWDEVKVSGSENFRREVWVEAAARGMSVKGYTPNDQDKATLAKRMVDTEASKVDQVQARDQQPGQAPVTEKQKQEALQAARAESFRNDTREIALKKHPELAGAYAAQTAIQKKMEADKLPADKQAVVQARVQNNLVNSIERGHIPDIQRREEITHKQEVTEEKGMGR